MPRVLLTEKSSARDFLLQLDDRTILERARRDADIPIFMYGKIQEGDALNRNRRIYTWEDLHKECIRYIEEEIKDRQAYGEIDHPEESAVPRLQYASHHIEDISFKGKEVWGKIKIYNAFAGPGDNSGTKIRNIILNGGQIGISSRALGSIEEIEDDDLGYYDLVQDDLSVICWDLVSRPSTVGSNVHVIQEYFNKARFLKQKPKKVLFESECFDKICGCNCHIHDEKIKELTENEKIYLKILGNEKYLLKK